MTHPKRGRLSWPRLPGDPRVALLPNGLHVFQVTTPATPRARQPVWARLLGALGVIVVGVPSAMLVSLTIPLVVDGFEPVGLAFLGCGIIGLATVVLLYRVARGNVPGRGAAIAMAAGVVIALGGVGTAYVALLRSFEKQHLSHMKSELRIFAAEQEEYFKQHGRFAGDTALLYKGQRYTSSVRIMVEHADDVSWRARATNPAATKRVCRATGSRSTPISDPVCD